jgi:hypothetical protein
VLTGFVPFFDNNHTFVGLISCDYSVSFLNQVLKEIDTSKNGISYVVDHHGLLVATSCDTQIQEIKDGQLLR